VKSHNYAVGLRPDDKAPGRVNGAAVAQGGNMSTRNDIKDGSVAETATYGLVYTRKCGWIDLGHACPIGGAQNFWHKMLLESTRRPEISCIGISWSPNKTKLNKSRLRDEYFLMEYPQTMCLRKHGMKVCKSWGQSYLVKKELPLHKMKSAALTIFLNTSFGFEAGQSSFPYNLFTDSGFSAEDLVSDLISFYRAVEPGRRYIKMCEPISQAKALAIWDKFGAVGSHKNNSFRPLLFPVDDDEGGISAPTYGELPGFLNSIKPLPKGFDLKHVRDFDMWD
jgi:hypothetical protein